MPRRSTTATTATIEGVEIQLRAALDRAAWAEAEAEAWTPARNLGERARQLAAQEATKSVRLAVYRALAVCQELRSSDE